MPRSGRSKRARRSSKRKRSPAGSGSESDNAAPSSSSAPIAGPLSLDAFLAMPEEIRSLILELAYSLPSSSSNDVPDTSTGSINDLDAATTINLACTSRWFNVQATLRLYTHVAITRPSALASLQRAISSRPQLGRLIKSLHVGAWDPLPESWHPLRARQAYVDEHGNQQPATTVFSHSLRSDSEAKLLPEGYTSASEWSFEHPDLDRRSIAISRAILAAQQSLGVDLKDRNEWHYRYIPLLPLLQVQAALDLCLINMRNFESVNHLDASSPSGTDHDTSPDYPPLIIFDTATTSTSSRTDTPCTLTRRDLLRHLARPGAPTDRFDHPLLFARSGLDKTSSVYTRDSLDRWEPTDQFVRGPEDLADVFSSSGGLEHPQENSRMTKEVLDPSLPSTATFGGLLALTRSLLAMTPRLENLSFTGFLERAVCGRRPIAAALKSLRCLSIGPPPETSQWYVPLRFDGLEEVKKLRICGSMLRGDEVEQIRGLYSEFQWSLVEQLDEEKIKSLGVLVDHLVGRKGVAPDAALRDLGFGELGKLRLPFHYSAAQKDPPEPTDEKEDESRSTYGSIVEVRLRFTVLKAMLARAVSPGELTAWETGRNGRNQARRLLLAELPVAGDSVTDEREALYKEGREWWEKNKKAGETHYHGYEDILSY